MSEAKPDKLRAQHRLWELAACGRHGTRERGEADNVWAASCYSCLVIHSKLEFTVRRCAEITKQAEETRPNKGIQIYQVLLREFGLEERP